MTTFNRSLLAIAVGLALSSGALAMSKDEYKQAKDRIEMDHKNDKAACSASSVTTTEPRTTSCRLNAGHVMSNAAQLCAANCRAFCEVASV